MKKKLILMCTAGVLVMTAVIGGTLAGFNTSTESKGVANITVNALGIDLLGGNAGSDSLETGSLACSSIVPGGQSVLQHNIVNNVEGGYELYTRVTIDKKWKDESLDPSKIHLYAGEDANQTELIAGAQVNGWSVWYSDDEQVVMYYTKPLKAGEASENMIDAVGFSLDMDNTYAGAEVAIDFSADAVQTIAAADSIPSEWGVYPTIAEDGTITSIEE